jgi:hypothetical protein
VKETKMVSMVIVLFLVAVAISLFLGRLAEVLTNRLRNRAFRQPSADAGSAAINEVRGNRAA